MRIEKTIKLNAAPSVVWGALTEPSITKLYFYECEAISDWQVGSPLLFKHTVAGEESFPVKGVIKSIEPNVLLEHTCYESQFENDPEKHTTVTYSLAQDGETTNLSVTQGEFPEDDDFSQHDASWDHVLNGLKELLESVSPD